MLRWMKPWPLPQSLTMQTFFTRVPALRQLDTNSLVLCDKTNQIDIRWAHRISLIKSWWQNPESRKHLESLSLCEIRARLIRTWIKHRVTSIFRILPHVPTQLENGIFHSSKKSCFCIFMNIQIMKTFQTQLWPFLWHGNSHETQPVHTCSMNLKIFTFQVLWMLSDILHSLSLSNLYLTKISKSVKLLYVHSLNERHFACQSGSAFKCRVTFLAFMSTFSGNNSNARHAQCMHCVCRVMHPHCWRTESLPARKGQKMPLI